MSARICGLSFLRQVCIPAFGIFAFAERIIAGADGLSHKTRYRSFPYPYLDDGSGSVTILESYRALIAADFRPVRTVEFHWYSAEVFWFSDGGAHTKAYI